MRTIQHHLQPAQGEAARDAGLAKFDVATDRIARADGFAQTLGFHRMERFVQRRFDRRFRRVIELLAFGGDGDRVLMADDQGTPVDGDDLLYVLARSWQASDRLTGTVVGTLMTNYGLEQALAALNIPFQRAKVGDRYVHQALVESGGTLGGETSGHLLCLDRATTGDGIVSALQVLEALGRDGHSLRQALSSLSKVPQKTINVRLEGGAAKAIVEAANVQQALQQAQAAVQGRGRAFLRPSGTEPVVRVTVEADDAGLMQDTLDRLSGAVRDAA